MSPYRIFKSLKRIAFIVIIFLSYSNTAVFSNESIEISKRDTIKNSQMKVIGIIGGISWASSIEYYRIMNEMVRDRFGSLYSANILMYSIPFKEFSDQERLAEAGDWGPLRETMINSALRLQEGGADFIVIASNTMNSTVEEIQKHIKIPILHIADAVGKRIKEKGFKKVALLGTKYTMEANFYKDRAKSKYGIELIVPNSEERNYINNVIFDELCNNVILDSSKQGYLKIINRLIEEDGVEAVVLGCTEIPLLIKQKDVKVPVFDSMEIHCKEAVNYSVDVK